ncbi:hypothetical protein FOIG_12642 [Fusarium odoratissimum NRRL 54006]|uniref:Uncharacterized protein n=1 Tax=Fusarium odoratissimum (strain NRRL 54006) TaxID=1089451 RepID=X0JDJ7_FUSO5|nr:uncharacterized protein FOIG_12642 [Fusarium odoratissimum NRRL 54006]EXL94446.1 hypothetical protein FOIG_12642 [Fusarium odoratissimum NRRL 54006]
MRRWQRTRSSRRLLWQGYKRSSSLSKWKCDDRSTTARNRKSKASSTKNQNTKEQRAQDRRKRSDNIRRPVVGHRLRHGRSN